jgi:hypothetical protein
MFQPPARTASPNIVIVPKFVCFKLSGSEENDLGIILLKDL